MLEEEVDDIVMASLRSPHGRRCIGFSTLRINIGTGVDEEFAGSILVIYCRPLSERLAGLQDIRSERRSVHVMA